MSLELQVEALSLHVTCSISQMYGEAVVLHLRHAQKRVMADDHLKSDLEGPVANLQQHHRSRVPDDFVAINSSKNGLAFHDLCSVK